MAPSFIFWSFFIGTADIIDMKIVPALLLVLPLPPCTVLGSSDTDREGNEAFVEVVADPTANLILPIDATRLLNPDVGVHEKESFNLWNSTASSPSMSPTEMMSESINEKFLEATNTTIRESSDPIFLKNDEDAPELSVPNLIVGGQTTSIGAYPYYVKLNGCGGSLIGPRVVLSAAHCNTDANGDFTTFPTYVEQFAYVGAYINPEDYNLLGDFPLPVNPFESDGSDRVEVVEQVIHPQYVDALAQGQGLINDFLLLRLKRDAQPTVDSDVKLRLRDDVGDINPGTPLLNAGLGRNIAGDPTDPNNQGNPTLLKDLRLFSISDEQCAPLLSIVPEVVTCASSPDGSSCQGDSGGPLIRDVGNIHYQVGVVSFGPVICEGAPGAYSQIPGNDEGFGFIQRVVCQDWEEESSICECNSDCNCSEGLTCQCVYDISSSSDVRFLNEFEKDSDQTAPDHNIESETGHGNESTLARKGPRKMKSDKSKSSCKRVKCSKGGSAVCR